MTRLPNKYVTTVTARLDPDDPDDYVSALTKYNDLSTLQSLVIPVLVESKVDMLDATYCFVDNLTPRGWKKLNSQHAPSYIVQFDLIES